MKPATRASYDAYCSQIALLNSTSDVTKKFSVDPTIQQTLEAKIQESSDFLKLINILPVDDLEGEKVGLVLGAPVAGRTDTSAGGKRGTVDPVGMENHPYRCEKTNSDTHLTYARLDAWAKFPNFQILVRDMIIKRQGLDRILIGWNGKTVAATTNKANFPLLQDVNIGWLQQMRLHAPARVLADGGLTADPAKAIYVAAGTPGVDVDYVNLDALAHNLLSLLDPWAREDSELVVIVSSDLMDDKYFPIINKAGDTATEVLARDTILKSARQIGGKPAISVPGFPPNAMLITKLSNLSIYWQVSTRRRNLLEVPDEDRVKNFESWNEAYVVEDYGYAALAENIVMTKKP